MIDQSKIRNFCIIAHIDHGKSTLADRIIEMTGTLTEREMQSQVLDNMELERERGITIKSQAAVRAAAAKYPDLHIIHFDAHADLRDDYLGAKLSHACVLRRCHEILGDDHIHQFCIRSGEREEFQFARKHTDFHPFTFDGLEETVKELKEKQVPVYFTIDLDCLDPSVFPGTGTPEAGGVSFVELLEAIRTVSQVNLVGADVNELAPMLDASGVSTATACKVLRELLLAVAK